MKLENIFEKIRKEDAILWIGSGFSIASGYPNGKQLSTIIYQALTDEEREEIPENLTLADLTEEFVRMKGGGKHDLIQILKRELSKPPTTLKAHETLAKIPHISTIITTNYDRLFEIAYNNTIHPIITESDIPYADKRVELFKIHGDINNPDSILLTRSDYNNFFYSNTHLNLIWTVVKARIANKAIIFIGYDLEDANVLNLLRGITDALGTNKREMFLVAPGMKEHKVNFLTQLGIQYVDSKGEPFIAKLYENIKDKIASDNDNNWVSPETVHTFFLLNNLKMDFKTVDNTLKIHNVQGNPGVTDSRLHLAFKKDNTVSESFSKFMAGESMGGLSIDGGQLDDFKILMNDVNILGGALDSYRISFKPQPKYQGTLAINFENGSEFDDISYTVFTSIKGLDIILEHKNCKFTLEAKREEFDGNSRSGSADFKISPPHLFKNVNDAISVWSLAHNISRGLAAKIYLSDNDKPHSLSARNSIDAVGYIESNLLFFDCLKKIERLHSVRFSDFGSYSEQEFENALQITNFAEEPNHIQAWEGEFKIELKDGLTLDILLNFPNGPKIIKESTEKEILEVYGKKFDVGYRIEEPLNLEVINEIEIRNNKTSTAILRSKTSQIKINFVSTLD